MRLRLASTIAAGTAFVILFAWLFWQNFALGGSYAAHWDAASASPRIGPLVPESRVSEARKGPDGETFRFITSEPIHFSVRLPISFETAKVKVAYESNAPLVELGALASEESWAYDLRPVGGSFFEKLGWDRKTENGVSLYARTAVFPSVAAFMKNAPASGVATYHASLSTVSNIPGYRAATQIRTFTTPFRGTTTLKVFLKNEPVHFSFVVQDMNRNAGADPLTVSAHDDRGLLTESTLPDDGEEGISGKLSALQTVVLHSNRLASGTVRIFIKASDDIVVRKLETTAQKWVFANRLYIADAVGYGAPAPFRVVTNGRLVRATTAHKEAFQEISVGGKKTSLNELNKPFALDTADAVRKNGSVYISGDYGDVRLETAGVFALSAEAFWSPDPLALTAQTDVDAESIQYILARDPQTETVFDFNALSTVGRKAVFVLSAPTLGSGDTYFKIKSIDVMFTRKKFSMHEYVEMIKRFLHL